ADPRVAEIVTEGLHYRNPKVYSLHAFCVMSNHVHAVFTPNLTMESLTEVRGPGRLRFESAEPTMDAIMKSLKGYTAYKANRVLNRMGSFWEEESYDHEVKNTEEFYRIVRYVLNNPVKAGLVGHWTDWKWSYCRENLIQSITY
ncbi:MAG: transposase, partial [Pyrinomonadaceae bacterium]